MVKNHIFYYCTRFSITKFNLYTKMVIETHQNYVYSTFQKINQDLAKKVVKNQLFFPVAKFLLKIYHDVARDVTDMMQFVKIC